MKPSIESPSTKTADQKASSASEGDGRSSLALGASVPLRDSWDWLAYARRPELLPEVMLAARPCLIILTTVLLVGTCAALAYWKSPRPQAGIDLLAEPSSPNLNLTSAAVAPSAPVVPPQPDNLTTPAVSENSLPIIVEERPLVVEVAPEPTLRPEPMIDDKVIAIPDVGEDISIRIPQREDSPMMQHWRMLGLHTVLAGALTVATGTGAEPNKDDVIVKQLAELKKSIEQLNETVKTLRSDNINADLKASKAEVDAGKAHKDIEDLKKQLAQLRVDLDELRKTSTVQKAFSLQPNGKAATPMGRIRLMNTYPEPMTIIVNDKVYHLQPQEIRLTEPLPAGTFTYEVLGVQRQRSPQLAANETFTINVHPR